MYAHLTAVYVDHNLQQQYLASLACHPTNSSPLNDLRFCHTLCKIKYTDLITQPVNALSYITLAFLNQTKILNLNPVSRQRHHYVYKRLKS